MVYDIEFCLILALLTFELHKLLIFPLDPVKPQFYYYKYRFDGVTFHTEMFP